MSECVIAVDLGGTTIKAALLDRDAHLIQVRRVTTTDAGHEAVLAQLVEMIERMETVAHRHNLRPRAIGLVVLGIVNERDGIAVTASNLGWRDVPVQAHVQRRVELPVAFGHDVRAGGLAETVMGAGRGVADVLVLPIGTGISAAMVLGGRPYDGSGYAGELGHIVVEPKGRLCGCGNRGCLETVASAAAIAERYRTYGGEPLGAHEIAARVRGEEALAKQVWDEAVDALATALAAYVSLLAPQLIVVGGGLGSAGETLLGPLRTRLNQHLTFQLRPGIVPALLGEEAACIGAGLLAWESIG